MKLSFGRHYGVCSHCGKIYNNVPRSALISLFIVVGILVIMPVFPLICLAIFILLPVLALISSKDSHFKRIDDSNRSVIKYDEKQKFKARVIEQYRDM